MNAVICLFLLAQPPQKSMDPVETSVAFFDSTATVAAGTEAASDTGLVADISLGRHRLHIAGGDAFCQSAGNDGVWAASVKLNEPGTRVLQAAIECRHGGVAVEMTAVERGKEIRLRRVRTLDRPWGPVMEISPIGPGEGVGR